ncbi:hypothetical protein O181_117205 [Austropuccinia psidii MF-1]|uniref:Uncharacterized protein n=1 Tax=Austropuccinia psidii MF-1 TaxID=1389203 RepID=A0A9Q3PY67_9BASI|nr:hypothetical protein [Austropuccinia psidii MF-1]
MEEILRRFCTYGMEYNDHEGYMHDWVTLLPAVQLAHNTSKHSTTEKTPALVEQGWNPLLPVCNNHSPGVRVFIYTPTQTPQISRSTICISIEFQKSYLLKHAYSLVPQYILLTSAQVGFTQYSLDTPL